MAIALVLLVQLPPPHLLVKTISQITVPSRTLVIFPLPLQVHTNLTDIINGTHYSSEQNLFTVPLLEKFSTKQPVYVLCIIINTSPDDVFLPKKIGI